MIPTHVIETDPRFWARVEPRPAPLWITTGDCWVWTGYTNLGGYGRLGRKVSGVKIMWLAHCYAYTLLVGVIPDDLTLDHLCRNPPCANPAHLEPVTQRVNNLRSDNVSAQNARKEACPRGHPYDALQMVKTKGTSYRYCRACLNEQRRAAYNSDLEERRRYNREKMQHLRARAAE